MNVQLSITHYLSAYLLLSGPALACEPPKYFTDQKESIVAHFCRAHTVAIVEVKDIFDSLSISNKDRPRGIYGAHYKVLETFKGDPLTHGLLYSNRAEIGNCGVDLAVGDLYVVALYQDPGLYSGQMIIKASYTDTTKKQATTHRIEYLRELRERFKSNPKFCSKFKNAKFGY
jgi:hypothetical protein